MKHLREFDFWRAGRFLLILVGLPMLLAACGEDEELAERRARLESYSLNDLQQMFEDGDVVNAMEVLRYRRNQGTATDEHYLLAAQILVALGDGIAAEATILQLQDRGFSPERSALTLARSFMLQRQPDDADEVLSEITLPAEDVFEGLILRGDVKLALNETETAGDFYQAAIQENPDSFSGYAAMALYLLQSGEINEARRYVNEAASRELEDPIVSYSLGMVARYDGRIDEAVRHFGDALQANPSDILSRLELTGIHISQDKFDEAQEELDAVYLAVPDHPMANYYSALLLLQEGNFAEAEDLLLRTGNFTRGYPLASQVYGFVTYELGKYSTAIPYLQRALQFFPNDLDVRLALADSLGRRSRSDDAMAILQPLLDQGGSVGAYIHATSAASGLGDIRSARRYIERALELAEQDTSSDPELIKTLQRQTAFARFLDDDLESATALLDAMYAEDGDDVESLTRKANMLMVAGNLEDARTTLNQLRSFDPESPVTNNLEGALLHRQQQFEEAIAAYSRALDKSPEYQSALKNRAFSYIQTEDFTNARKDLEVLQQLTEPDAQMLAMYGRALVETGAAQQALEVLDQAVDALPNFFLVYSDRAEALAELGYLNRAISDAEHAKRLNPNDEAFRAYADEKQEEWRGVLQEQEKAREDARQARLAELAEKRKAQEERLKSLSEGEDSLLADDEENQAAILAELRKLAEENRKLDAEEADETEDYQPLTIEKSPEELEREEMEKAIRTHRNQLFGAWVVSELGLSGADASRYMEALQRADESEPGDTDIIRKVISDLEDAGKRATIQSLEQKIAEKMAEAQAAYNEAN